MVVLGASVLSEEGSWETEMGNLRFKLPAPYQLLSRMKGTTDNAIFLGPSWIDWLTKLKAKKFAASGDTATNLRSQTKFV